MRVIARQFQILGDYEDQYPIGTGHINDTVAVVFSQSGQPNRYVFQRINHEVFSNPQAVMDNVSRVTRHIREKLEQSGIHDVSRRVLTLIPTLKGREFYRDEDGNYWRAYLYIENAHTFNKLECDEHAFEAARAFGLFTKMLADLPKPPLHETIPNFHHGPKRYQAFEQALAEDACDRAITAKPEIEFLQRNHVIFDELQNMVDSGDIPIRITHNDTKINNVMLDNVTGEGICPIDLDTVMPGVALHDFGDMARTSLSPTEEDERDLTKIRLLMPRYEAIVRGYLESAGEILLPVERDNLTLGAKMLTLCIGCRFLTDFLQGDPYFKTRRENHNLDRCRTQFKLVERMLENEEEMVARVEKIQAGCV